MQVTLRDAIDYFLDNRDNLEVFEIRQIYRPEDPPDYAVRVLQTDYYLVVEKDGKGILLAKLSPDLVEFRPVADPEPIEFELARRIREANLHI
ncbi:MAG: hypothetical protein ACOYU7_03765 [Bacillota bacterium]